MKHTTMLFLDLMYRWARYLSADKNPAVIQGVAKRCHLSCLTNSALVHESKCGGREGVSGSQLMSTAVHKSLNKHWRSNSIFNLCSYRTDFGLRHILCCHHSWERTIEYRINGLIRLARRCEDGARPAKRCPDGSTKQRGAACAVGYIIMIVITLLKKGYRFSCPQLGCHSPNSPWS
jgi:hypothetical protein